MLCRSIFVCLFSLLTAACGQRDYTVEQTSDFWEEHRGEFISAIERKESEKKYEWVAHIHFYGNDLLEKLFENQTQDPFQVEDMEDSESGPYVWAKTDYPDQSVLGTITFRHTSSHRAAKTFETFFECSRGHSDLLERTLVVGSGGSHGAWALQNFSKLLKKRCGRKLDFAIVADAIAQPGIFPMGSFTGLEEGGQCLHFYQRNSKNFLKGAPLKGCTNVKVLDAAHFGVEGLAQYPLHHLTQFLDTFEFRQTHQTVSK